MGVTESQYVAALTRCIEEHYEAVKRAHEAWEQVAELTSSMLRHVQACLAAGTSWEEVGRLLAEVADGTPPEELLPQRPSAPISLLPLVINPDSGPARVPTQPSTGKSARPLSIVDEQGVPRLLARAYAVVCAVPEKEIASRDLAIGLDHNPNTIGPDLCALLREVGVTVRPRPLHLQLAGHTGWVRAVRPAEMGRLTRANSRFPPYRRALATSIRPRA